MVGKTFAHYEVVEPLGEGGMGEVYRARDTKLDRDVALKILPEEFAADPERLARLEREAKLLAALSHPYIATIHSLEEDDGVRFLVFELVKGETLERQLAGGPLPIDRALEIGKQVAEALEAAHAAGIVHRDLKPANILVTPDGRAKVLDFGIAKSITVGADAAATAQDTNLTIAGTLVGTPAYMSPEPVRGEAIDKRAGVWAFGCFFSPDGNWIAYVSDASGRPEVYIRPYPMVEGTERRVSEGGGLGPVWSPDGSELYYPGGDSLMVVATPLGPGFMPGRPRPLFPLQGFRFSGNAAAFDVHPDGDRFIMVTQGDPPPPFPNRIDVVLNWFDELKQRVPTGR